MKMTLEQQRDHLIRLLKANELVIEKDGDLLYWDEASYVPLFPDNGRPDVPPPPPVKPVA